MADRTDHAPARPRVTLKHVAEATGLGVTTVSDILNGQESGRTRYSRVTQDRVLKVVAELGYVVDRAAQQLRRGRSGTIGLLLTRHLHDAVFARTVDLAETELRRLGYSMTLAVGHGPTVADRLEHLRQSRVEGIIFGPAYTPADVLPLDVMDVPAVVFGGPCDGRYDEATVDLAAARRLAATHLAGLGHRRVGYLGPHRPRSPGADGAVVLRALGLADPDWCVSAPDRADGTAEMAAAFARRWAAAGDRPTAVLCHDDEAAAVALSAFWAAGVGVPDDVSVVGCDDMPMAAHTVPPLTTVDRHAGRQMAAAADMVARRLAHPDDPAAAVRVDPALVVRRSTKAAG